MQDAAEVEEALADAGLRYSSDEEPGIARRRSGRGFSYVDAQGRVIRDPAVLSRIRSLAIPPAYRDVWICRSANGHLQATGIDARGRKQYRYHPEWRALRDADKFERLAAFGKSLSRIRKRVSTDIRATGMTRERVVATVVRLLDRTLIRIGNEQYARANRSYGLTTLRDRHVAVRGKTIHFEFRGKAGIVHKLSVDDPAAADALRDCLDLPGQELFQYVDDAGTRRTVTSTDVNAYLREASGADYTAKDFRTWHATIAALEALGTLRFTSAREAKGHVKDVLCGIAARLGNTPAMCRKCYVHPGVLEAFLLGRLSVSKRTSRERLLQLLSRTAQSPAASGPKRRQRAFPTGADKHSALRQRAP